MTWIIGEDLGQSNDFTSLSVTEWTSDPRLFNIRGLQRFPLGTPYPVIVDRTIEIWEGLGSPSLVIDATGVGRAVLDLYYDRGVTPIAVTITGGDIAKSRAQVAEETKKKEGMIYSPSLRERLTWNVPKRDLVSAMNVAFQQKQVKISGNLPDAKTLIDEMMNFRMKFTAAGHDTYEAWREGIHDDLVLAVALPIWWVSRSRRGKRGQDIPLFGQSLPPVPSLIDGPEDKWGRPQPLSYMDIPGMNEY